MYDHFNVVARWVVQVGSVVVGVVVSTQPRCAIILATGSNPSSMECVYRGSVYQLR